MKYGFDTASNQTVGFIDEIFYARTIAKLPTSIIFIVAYIYLFLGHIFI